MKVEVAVLERLPVPNSPYGLCGRKATLDTDLLRVTVYDSVRLYYYIIRTQESFSLVPTYLFKPPANLSVHLTLFYFFHYFVFHCFLATVRIFVFCYCSLFVCFFFFLCFLLFFVFIVVISHSVFVSEMKLFVRLTLCVFSNCNIMSSSPISYSLLMST